MILAVLSRAQINDPVNWSFEMDNDNTHIIMTAKMQKDWVVYSQNTGLGGPVPTAFKFEKSEDYTISSEVNELSEAIIGFDKVFEVEVIKFKDEATFEQTVQIHNKGAIIHGSVTYMTCDGQKCLPPRTVPFEVKT